MKRLAPVAALVAVLAVVGYAVGAPSPGGTTDTSFTISGLDPCTTYQAAVKKVVNGQPQNPAVKVVQQTTGCAPPPTTTTPPPPPPGDCDRTLAAGGNLSSFVSSLQAGETGCLSPGSYSAGSVSVTRENVTLTSVSTRATITVSSIDLYGSGDKLVNLKIVGNTTSNTLGVRGSGQIAENNEVTNNHEDASCVMLEGSGSFVRRNVIHGCGSDAEGGNKHHGVYGAGNNNQVTDNVFYDIKGYGLQLYPGPSGNLVAHNTFDSAPTNRGGIVAYGSGNTVENNIVAYEGGVEDRGNNTLRGNCVTDDPRFVNRAARDYRLQPDSPCAGKGVR